MTKEKLFAEKEIAVEPYGQGFILCDYSGNRGDAAYCGISMKWSSQPVVNDPFASEEQAVKACMDNG